MERLIVLDTETTGMDPADGHKIVEIGCVELVGMRVGETRQWYVNPEREIPREAIEVHGITNERVKDCPVFAAIADELAAFLGEDQLVAHNAAFDLKFLNAELRHCRRPELPAARAIDTVLLARRKFPGQSASLDALCKRFNIDASGRTFHGALLDAQLLAEVYVELRGGSQFSLDLAAMTQESRGVEEPSDWQAVPPRQWPLGPGEAEAHAALLKLLDKESGGQCVWQKGG